MKKSNTYYPIKVILLFMAFFWKVIEFGWQLLLGSEISVVITTKGLITFSITTCIITLLIIILSNLSIREGNIYPIAQIVIMSAFLIFWSGAVIDMIQYSRHTYLMMVRTSGFINTLAILVYTILLKYKGLLKT